MIYVKSLFSVPFKYTLEKYERVLKIQYVYLCSIPQIFYEHYIAYTYFKNYISK